MRDKEFSQVRTYEGENFGSYTFEWEDKPEIMYVSFFSHDIYLSIDKLDTGKLSLVLHDGRGRKRDDKIQHFSTEDMQEFAKWLITRASEFEDIEHKIVGGE